MAKSEITEFDKLLDLYIEDLAEIYLIGGIVFTDSARVLAEKNMGRDLAESIKNKVQWQKMK